jgi:hypothetical protein
LLKSLGLLNGKLELSIKSLKEDGILIVDSFNKKKYDKTNWYSINEVEFITDVDEATAYDNVKTLDRSIKMITMTSSKNLIPLEYQNDTTDSIKVIGNLYQIIIKIIIKILHYQILRIKILPEKLLKSIILLRKLFMMVYQLMNIWNCFNFNVF